MFLKYLSSSGCFHLNNVHILCVLSVAKSVVLQRTDIPSRCSPPTMTGIGSSNLINLEGIKQIDGWIFFFRQKQIHPVAFDIMVHYFGDFFNETLLF